SRRREDQKSSRGRGQQRMLAQRPRLLFRVRIVACKSDSPSNRQIEGGRRGRLDEAALGSARAEAPSDDRQLMWPSPKISRTQLATSSSDSITAISSNLRWGLHLRSEVTHSFAQDRIDLHRHYMPTANVRSNFVTERISQGISASLHTSRKFLLCAQSSVIKPSQYGTYVAAMRSLRPATGTPSCARSEPLYQAITRP